MRKREDISTLEPTRYEVALYVNGRLQVVLGYTGRKSRDGLATYWNAACDVVRKLIDDGVQPESAFYGRVIYSTARGWESDTIRLAFTGETERSAAMIAAFQAEAR
jgi:hypothetical protein